ncbi:DUF1697 domain-containing protein [Chitinimonas sp.]|uniref:DUF1697 domain-containing protein n=1 Tax=Chitinimonas sp. TaxID=1934313 RepID=UPI002F927B81
MNTFIALLRGINVGKAKRIAMADLRAMLEALGHHNPRTLLNSGNAVFESSQSDCAAMAKELEAAITAGAGFSCAVVVISAADLNAIAAQNPLLDRVTDPSRHLVAFTASATNLPLAQPLLEPDWSPDAVAIGAQAIYLWCEVGILDSKILPAFNKLTKEAFTTRNWATVLKLQEMVAV